MLQLYLSFLAPINKKKCKNKKKKPKIMILLKLCNLNANCLYRLYLDNFNEENCLASNYQR